MADLNIPLPGDNDVAQTTLDDASNEFWREDLRNEAASRREGARFWTDAMRSAFIEGKVGLRESVAMKNIPPANGQTGP